MLSSDDICEIRIPTYRRPKLLQRALRSVVDQTHPRWRCVVFDDCPDGSAQPVVERFGEARFQYRRNPRPLGAIGNIDQCFRNQPYADGSFACVVEDDNFLMPEHLERQLRNCVDRHVEVTFSAQYCEKVIAPGEPGELTETKTLAWIYPEGVHDVRTILPAILFSHAFSNGSVFWRIGGNVDFEIGEITENPGIQETARVLRLKGSVYVSHEATAVWRANDPADSYVNKVSQPGTLKAWREKWRNLIERRQAISLRSIYIRNYGLGDALAFPERFGPTYRERIERSLLLCGKHVDLTDRPLHWRIAQILTGFAFRALVPNRLDARKLHAELRGQGPRDGRVVDVAEAVAGPLPRAIDDRPR